jgi:alanyl-tRNA synthetase/misacylated tRNA(Ala) deacylase
MAAALETVPVFYEDVYRRTLEVWVDALVEDASYGPCLVLSETLCHPHGGGQKGDRGRLELTPQEGAALGVAPGPEAALPLVDTRRSDGRILHVAGAALAQEEAEGVLVGSRPFTLRLDWDFRHRQMRLHSAAHLLHCFVEQALGRPVDYPETSDLQPDYGLNRYERKELLTPAQMEGVLETLNEFIAAGHAIVTSPDPEREGYRFWRCEQWVIPCGGTHPADTREIGTVRAELSLKRGRTSMTFRVGEP